MATVVFFGAGCSSHAGLSAGKDASPPDLAEAANAPPDTAIATDANLASPDTAILVPDAFLEVCGPVTSSSDLPGVRLEITAGPCTLTLAQAAAGVQFDYRLLVDADVPGIVAASDVERCERPDGSGLVVTAVITGNGQSFCPTCDLGRCLQNSTITTAKAGSFDYTLAWNGLNWQGPSDFGAPQGPAFPIGSYTLAVTATGTRPADGGMQPFTVAVSRPLAMVVQ